MIELKVKNREILGKKTRKLRRDGLIPAELFGHGLKNRHLSVPEKDFIKVYREAGEHTLINLITENNEKLPVIVSNISRHPISQKFLSVDFHQVRMDEKIQTKVPIEFTGVAPAIKNGLVVVKVLNEIEIESLPNAIPKNFEIDLSTLENVGQVISVKDLKAPPGVKILAPQEMVIVTVTEKQEEVSSAAPAAPTATATQTETASTTPAHPTTPANPEQK
jgi:large subunit ribosomal protein L25